MFTKYLADHLKNNNITVNTYTPGFTRSNFGRPNFIMKALSALIFVFARSPSKSAKTAIYLASSETDNITGEYFVNSKIKKTNDMSNNKNLQKELWELSEKLTKK